MPLSLLLLSQHVPALSSDDADGLLTIGKITRELGVDLFSTEEHEGIRGTRDVSLGARARGSGEVERSGIIRKTRAGKEPVVVVGMGLGKDLLSVL